MKKRIFAMMIVCLTIICFVGCQSSATNVNAEVTEPSDVNQEMSEADSIGTTTVTPQSYSVEEKSVAGLC